MSNKAVVLYIYRKQVPNYSVIYFNPCCPGSEFIKVTRLWAECGNLIQFLARHEIFSVLQSYGTHGASYPRGNRHSHSGSKVAWASRWSLTSVYHKFKNVWSYNLFSLTCLLGVNSNSFTLWSWSSKETEYCSCQTK